MYARCPGAVVVIRRLIKMSSDDETGLHRRQLETVHAASETNETSQLLRSTDAACRVHIQLLSDFLCAVSI